MSLKKPNKPVLFLARREENGCYTIYDVDIFGMGDRVPTTALSQAAIDARTEKMTAGWLDDAVSRHEKLRAETGYVPPVHIWHNEDGSNDGRPPAGYACELRRGDGKGMTQTITDPATGEEVVISRAGDPARLYVNFRGVWPEVFEQQIARNKLPYRSVEILDTGVPDISSVALMFSTPPFFALRPLSVHLDQSKKAEAFQFQPMAMAGAHFKAAKRTSVSFFTIKGDSMSLKLASMVRVMRSSGLADTKDEALKRMRFMFAADDKPPTEDELKKATDAGFTADEDADDKKLAAGGEEEGKKKDEKLAADDEDNKKEKKLKAGEEDKKDPPKAGAKNAAAPEEVEKGEGGKKPTPPEKVETGEGKKAKPTPPEDISKVPEGGTTKSLSEGGAMLRAKKFAGEEPPKKEEKKEEPFAGKETPGEEAAEAGAGAPPKEGAQPPAAPSTPPAPGAAPAVSAAPATEMVQPNQPGMNTPGAEIPGATTSLLTIVQGAVEETMQQALAPLVQEIRGMLSSGAMKQAPGGVDMLAPMVAMKAAFGFGSRFAAAFAKKFAGNEKLVQPAAVKTTGKQGAAEQMEEDTKFAALQNRLNELENERRLEKRVSYFKGIIDEAVAESNGLIRIDNIDEVARTAAEMPVRKGKQFSANGQVGKEVEIDLGREHVRQLLAQAGATLPPPPIGFSAEDGAAREGMKQLDPDVQGFGHHNRALSTAQTAAKMWDDSPRLQKMTARKTFINSEVYAAHKVEAKERK